MSTKAAQESLPGWRNSNDYVDFCSIAIPPSVDEVVCLSTPFLPTADASFSHVDRQFRLLRHELVAGVTGALAFLNARRTDAGKTKTLKYTKGGGSGRPPSLLVLPQAKRGAVIASGNGGAASLLIHFSWPTSHTLSRLRSAGKRREYLQATSEKEGGSAGGRTGRNVLKEGSLVAVTDTELKPLFFATIAHRDEALLAGGDGTVNVREARYAGDNVGSGRGGGDKGRGGRARKSDEWRRRQEARPAVGLFFFNRKDWEAALLLSKYESWGCLVSLDVDLSAYEPVLKRLQAMEDLPMRDLIVDWHATCVPPDPGSPPANVPQPVKSGASSAAPHPQPPQPPLYEGRESTAIAQLAESFVPAASSALGHMLQMSPPALEGELPAGCHFDPSQRMAMAQVLRQRVSLVQGPPGTGKTILGVFLGKIVLSSTSEKILCLCPTDHSLASLLGGMHDAGITSMVLVGDCGKTAKLDPYQMEHRPACNSSKSQTRQLMQLEKALDAFQSKIALLQRTSHLNRKPEITEVVKWLRRHNPEAFEELRGAITDESGETVDDTKDVSAISAFVVHQWLSGMPRPTFLRSMAPAAQEQRVNDESATASSIWSLAKDARKAAWVEWGSALKQKAAKAMTETIGDQHKLARERTRLLLQKDLQRVSGARIIGCTAASAVVHHELLVELRCGVVLVDDAAEVLEAHVLATLTESTKHVIMLGDRKQRRPKMDQYSLCVESGKGLDLNVSLFERLIQGGYPHKTLQVQHRLPSEISTLVKGIAYPELRDGPGTSDRPSIRGVRDRVCFVAHRNKETTVAATQWRKLSDVSASKMNLFEVRMVVKTVRYLLLQGYKPEQILVLTPYLGQLRELRKATDQANGNGGFLTRSCAGVRMATVESYAGEEADIVVCSFVRSKRGGPMGLVGDPNRLNFASSRARHGMILFGDIDFFTSDAAKNEHGRHLWLEFASLLEAGGHIYRDGLPVMCETHKTPTDLPTPEAFDEYVPDGGCGVVCGAMLHCGHPCPRRCHPGFDPHHDKTPCKIVLEDICAKGHSSKSVCSKDRPGGLTCQWCKREEAVGRQEMVTTGDEVGQDKPGGEASVESAEGRPAGELDSEKSVHDSGAKPLNGEEGGVKPNADEENPSREGLRWNLSGLQTAANATPNTLEEAKTVIGSASRPSLQEVAAQESSFKKAGSRGGSKNDGNRTGGHEGQKAAAGEGRRSIYVEASLGRTSGLANSETPTGRGASHAGTAAHTAWPHTWGSSRTEQEPLKASTAVSYRIPPLPNMVAATAAPYEEMSDGPEGPDNGSSPFLCIEEMYVLREACDIAGIPSDSPDLRKLGDNAEVHDALRRVLVLARAEGGIGFSSQKAGALLRKVAADRAALSRLEREAMVVAEKLASDLVHAEDAVTEVDAMVAKAAKEDEDQELLGGTLEEVFAAAEAADTVLEGQAEEELLQAAVAEADAAVRKEAVEGRGGEELLALLVQVKQVRQKVLKKAREERGRMLAVLTNAQHTTQQSSTRYKEERQTKLVLMVKKKWEKRGDLNRIKEKMEKRRAAEAASKAVLRRIGACPAGFDWYRQGAGWRCAGGSHYVPGSSVAVEEVASDMS